MKAYRRVSGQSLVEFALVIPLLLLIVVVCIDLSRIVYFHSALTNAVREGARYASVTQDNAGRVSAIQQRVLNKAVTLPLNASDVTVTFGYCVLPVVDPLNPGDTCVTVFADMKIAPMVPFMAQIIGTGTQYDINARATMRMTPFGKSG